MKNKLSVKDTLKNGCVIFTVITVISYALGLLLSGKDNPFIPTLTWIILFLIFSLVLAFANIILKNPGYSLGIRLGLHFLATASLYFVVVVLCGGFIRNGAQTLIALVLFVILYGLFAILYAILSSGKKKKKNKKEKYDSMFS
ncbi:MAG: DUF3021 family protein [Clostridia bacterium]|nr:DUF3021 family protein [Clostridia bacterium]